MMRVSLLAVLTLLSPLRAQDHGVKLPPGFKITLFADHTLANDIYCMTLDEKGHVLVSSRGWVKLLEDTDNDGKADKVQTYSITKTGAMGMCCDSKGNLLIMADGWLSVSDSRMTEAGVKKIIPLQFGEHGGHAIRQGPDGCWYVVGGNDAGLAKMSFAATSPIKSPEAGGILRISKDLKHVECIAQGFRNPYDFDFTPMGDIITYDSDTERDYLFPWYSPTRMYHVAHAQHHGWRLNGYMRSLARRDYYPDTVDILASIGRGSPTGVTCYRHVQLPKHYHGGVFACDWTFGKIYFLPLEVHGSTYKTKPEVFLEPAGIDGFAPNDICVAPDGGLYVSIGGRGTRGAVYKIDYVGTEKEPAGKWIKPKEALDKILDAPQPLDAWSRSDWEPMLRDIIPIKLVDVVHDEKATTSRRVRAIEVMSSFFDGLTPGQAATAATSGVPEIRARVAWSLGQSNVKNIENILLLQASDQDDRVRLAALDAIGDRLQQGRSDATPFLAEVLTKNLGDQDKRVRQSASRVVHNLDGKTWGAVDDLVSKADLRTRLTFALCDFRGAFARTAILTDQLQLVLLGLQSDNYAHRFDAIRLLMLIDGDWCLNNPPTEAQSAYALQRPRQNLKERDQAIREAIRKLFPTGDKNFDHEAARYLAMIEDDNIETVAKISAQITSTSSAVDDIHHLLVLSRLKGKRTVEHTKVVVDALFGLEKKLAGLQLRVKQNWSTRLSEMVLQLIILHPKMIETMIKHPNFVLPAHVALTTPFAKDNKLIAARLFLDAVKKDADFAWSVDLIDLLACLPLADHRPLFRKQWADYSLRDAMLSHLAAQPEEADRAKFLDGLDSPNRAITLACADALRGLPKDGSAKNLVPVLRRLRSSLLDPKERELREKLLSLVNREVATSFAIVEFMNLKENYEPIFAWFEKEHPAENKLLRGDDEDADAWKKLLANVVWEKGDAEKGQKIFQQRSCVACHTGSSKIGPDLMGAAGRFSRDDLFTSIISPSRDVAPAYRVNEIETLDGKSYSGVVVFESADGVIMQLDAVKTVRIDNAQIASRQPGRKSLMPSGLLKDLKPDDLADIYAYLRALK